jgi:hypothetical protein
MSGGIVESTTKVTSEKNEKSEAHPDGPPITAVAPLLEATEIQPGML